MTRRSIRPDLHDPVNIPRAADSAEFAARGVVVRRCSPMVVALGVAARRSTALSHRACQRHHPHTPTPKTPRRRSQPAAGRGNWGSKIRTWTNWFRASRATVTPIPKGLRIVAAAATRSSCTGVPLLGGVLDGVPCSRFRSICPMNQLGAAWRNPMHPPLHPPSQSTHEPRAYPAFIKCSRWRLLSPVRRAPVNGVRSTRGALEFDRSARWGVTSLRRHSGRHLDRRSGRLTPA